jgi:hypothetical protein
LYPSSNALPYGFRIVGNCQNERRLIDWQSAFVAYSQCDALAELDREAYLSAFTFGAAFRDHLNATGSTKGYRGDCWSSWLWFDIDRDADVEAATHDARRLMAAMVDRFGVVGDDLLAFYSGSKGYHLGLPTSLWNPSPSASFPAYCRALAERIAATAGVSIDVAIYDHVRAFRAPNSRHAKTGRYKRWLRFDELMTLKPSRVLELAASPEPFEIPAWPKVDAVAGRWWQEAIEAVEQQRVQTSQRRQERMQGGIASQSLNRSTLEFIREGASTGDRHRLLFSAAANLAEFGCSLDLALALLGEAALDSGLTPSEVRRQIECGLNYKGMDA